MKSRAGIQIELNYIEWESERGLENLFLSMCQHYLFRKMIQWNFLSLFSVVLVALAVASEGSFLSNSFHNFDYHWFSSDPPDAFMFPSQN